MQQSSGSSTATESLKLQPLEEKLPASTEQHQHNKLDDVDGGYGWVIVLASFLLTFSTWGLNSAYGIYFTYYSTSNRFPGATTLEYSAIGGMSFGVGLFFAPVINYIQGLIGTRPTILLGNCLQFAAAIMASYAVNIWQLFLTQGLLQSFGLAFISLPALTLVSQWFVKKRVLANSITVAGSGVGGVVFNLGLQKIIDTKSVEWALRAQGIISAVLVLIAVTLVRTKSKHHKVEFTLIDVDTIKCTGFWMLVFYLITTMFGYVILLYCLSDFTVSLGYTSNQGSIVATMVQVSMCFGRPFAGYLADKIGPYTVTAIFYLMATIFTLGMWVPAQNYATTIALGLLEGFFIGTVFSTAAAITARLVTLPKLNVAFCMSWVFCGVAALFSNIIGTSMTSGTSKSKYQHTAIFSGVSFFCASMSSLLLRGYIIARDKILEEYEGEEPPHELHIRVPPKMVFQSCLKWPKKRA